MSQSILLVIDNKTGKLAVANNGGFLELEDEKDITTIKNILGIKI